MAVLEALVGVLMGTVAAAGVMGWWCRDGGAGSDDGSGDGMVVLGVLMGVLMGVPKIGCGSAKPQTLFAFALALHYLCG